MSFNSHCTDILIETKNSTMSNLYIKLQDRILTNFNHGGYKYIYKKRKKKKEERKEERKEYKIKCCFNVN